MFPSSPLPDGISDSSLRRSLFKGTVLLLNINSSHTALYDGELDLCAFDSEGLVKVTVQFETEGNGQNEIFSHVDRSEVKF